MRRPECSKLAAVPLAWMLLICATPGAFAQTPSAAAPSGQATAAESESSQREVEPVRATAHAVDFEGSLATRLRGPADGTVLSSEEAARRSVQASASVRARKKSRAAEAAATRQADLAWWPRLTLTARYTHLSPYQQPGLGPLVAAPGAPDGPLPPGTQLVKVESTFPAFTNIFLLQAQLVAPITDYVFRVSQLTDSAKASEEAARLRQRAEELQVAANARLAYYGVAQARLAEAVSDQTIASAEAQQRAARDRFDVGRSVQVDVLDAEARVAAAEGLLQSAQLSTERAEAELRILTGADPSEPLALPVDLLRPLPNHESASLESLYDEARRKRLELRAYEASARALGHQESATRAEALPKLDLFANGYYANPNYRFLPPEEGFRATWDIGAQLTWTPNDWAVTEARASRTAAERERVTADRDALEQALRQEVSAAWTAVRRADTALPSAATRRRAAEEAYRVRREMYDFGKASIVEVLNAETEVVRARLEWVQALIDQRIARVRLEHALGRDANVSP